MRKSALLAVASLLVATPAAADVVELHIGQTDFENADEMFPASSEGEGKTYRLMATNFVEQNAYLRLEARVDSLDITDSGVSLLDTDRTTYRFGLGERWGSKTFDYGMDIGAVQIKLKQDRSTTSSSSETSGYLGLDLHGTLDAFEWQVDGTYYHKVPQLSTFEILPTGGFVITPREADSEVWTGGQMVWNFSDGPALGFRYEISGEVQSTTLFMRFEM